MPKLSAKKIERGRRGRHGFSLTFYSSTRLTREISVTSENPRFRLFKHGAHRDFTREI
ncbi:MAG TPA: hypothetical protein VKA34_19695 [Balneolales bacterium]|nr:hypothetical protein [Balneolales bacterium]